MHTQEALTLQSVPLDENCHRCTHGGCQHDSAASTADPEGTPACRTSSGSAASTKFNSRWVTGGAGAAAAQLLQKLRWCVLGPQFNWTERVYEDENPFRPLPAELRGLAVRFAEAIAAVDMQPVSDAASAKDNSCMPIIGPSGEYCSAAVKGGAAEQVISDVLDAALVVQQEHEGSSAEQPDSVERSDGKARAVCDSSASAHGKAGSLRSGDTSKRACSDRNEDRSLYAAAALPAHHAEPNSLQHSECSSAEHLQRTCRVQHRGCSSGKAAWEPNVALVNYYREGETLGGHKDDAEEDMNAPIVAISLGCDAIFLLGGVNNSCSFCQSMPHMIPVIWVLNPFHIMSHRCTSLHSVLAVELGAILR